MIVLIEVEATVLVRTGTDENDQPIRVRVPDLNLPPSLNRVAWSTTDHGVPRLSIERNGRSVDLLIVPFGSIGGVKAYTVEIRDRAEMAFLRNRLGAGSVTPLRRAMQRPAVKTRAKEAGLRLYKRGATVVNVYPQLTTCGRAAISHDLDDDETEDDLPEITGMDA